MQLFIFNLRVGPLDNLLFISTACRLHTVVPDQLPKIRDGELLVSLLQGVSFAVDKAEVEFLLADVDALAAVDVDFEDVLGLLSDHLPGNASRFNFIKDLEEDEAIAEVGEDGVAVDAFDSEGVDVVLEHAFYAGVGVFVV